jgi:glycosyltransferase involved in cell wall biosynthesis
MNTKIAIVIPAYNEHQFLSTLLKSIRHFSTCPIIIVDDGSEIPLRIPKALPAGRQGLIYRLRHKLNLGKGVAMTTGADFAFRNLKVISVIFMDADGQHDPKYLPQFEDLLTNNYDVVFGSRTQTSGVPLVRFLGNKFASVYINVLFGAYVSDILSGYRGLSKRAYQLLKWNSPRYGVETEMVARLGIHKNKLKYTEIPISTIYIDKYKGVSILDAVKILGNSLWWKLS